MSEHVRDEQSDSLAARLARELNRHRQNGDLVTVEEVERALAKVEADLREATS